MAQLKEINGNHYLDAKVVMLATGTKENSAFWKGSSANTLVLNTINAAKGNSFNGQHLYVISNEEIKKGDLFYHIKTNSILRCTGINNSSVWFGKYETHPKFCKKIISTTDSSLKVNKTDTGVFKDLEYELPDISEDFIKDYIKSYNNETPIVDILVEFEYFENPAFKLVNKNGDGFQLKLKDNTIIINHRLKKFLERYPKGISNEKSKEEKLYTFNEIVWAVNRMLKSEGIGFSYTSMELPRFLDNPSLKD